MYVHASAVMHDLILLPSPTCPSALSTEHFASQSGLAFNRDLVKRCRGLRNDVDTEENLKVCLQGQLPAISSAFSFEARPHHRTTRRPPILRMKKMC